MLKTCTVCVPAPVSVTPKGVGVGKSTVGGCERWSSTSSFGITVDRKRELKWLFSQEKATLHTVNEDHTNSETALAAEV